MWAAGPEWLVATPDRTVREPVVRVTDRGDGELEYETIPFSASRQQEEDDHLDAQLALLELPPRPRGFDWYMRLAEPQQTFFDDYLADIEDGQPDSMSGIEYLIDLHKRMIALVPGALIYAENAR